MVDLTTGVDVETTVAVGVTKRPTSIGASPHASAEPEMMSAHRTRAPRFESANADRSTPLRPGGARGEGVTFGRQRPTAVRVVWFVGSALFFVFIHLGVSGTRLRDVLVRTLGESPFMGLFSLASLAGMVALASTYEYAAAETTVLWVAPVGLQHSGALIMLVALFFVVVGLTTPSPTLAQMDGLLEREDAVKGILRITRHPFLMGTSLWALFHMACNGDTAALVLFGSLFIVCAVGAPSIDAKRARKHGAAWTRFAERTSILPFGAISSGRNHLALGEIAWWQWLVVLGVYAAVIVAHPWLFGVPAIPGT